jgi:hypothetical protein
VQGSSQERYFALSYVWGGALQVQTTLSNIQELQKPGAFLKINQLPKTLQDAITLTRNLGCRYIWIDAVSIIQDSPTKLTDIQHMGKIYSHAYLTIVAVDGQNANVPLPGVQAHSRLPIHKSEIIDGSTFISDPPRYVDTHLLGSPYESRGWTLQERVLSTRLLYITAQQILFQCNDGFRSEASDIEFDIREAQPANEYDLMTGVDSHMREWRNFWENDDGYIIRSGTKGGVLAGREIGLLARKEAHFYAGNQDGKNQRRKVKDCEKLSHDLAWDYHSNSPYLDLYHDFSKLSKIADPRTLDVSLFGTKSRKENQVYTIDHTFSEILPTIENIEHISRPTYHFSSTLPADQIPQFNGELAKNIVMYYEIVQIYTSRHLTDNSDILRAFSGISSILAAALSSKLVNGIPGNMLASGLLWAAKGQQIRRLGPDGKPCYPAWCWAGWVGDVVYPAVMRGITTAFSNKMVFNAPSRITVQSLKTVPSNDVLIEYSGPIRFRARLMPCKITVPRSGLDPDNEGCYHTFSLDGSEQSCGVLFCSLPKSIDQDGSSIAVMGIDRSPLGELDLRAKYPITFPLCETYAGGPCRGRTLYILLIRHVDNHHERVAAGKMLEVCFDRKSKMELVELH